MPELCLAGVTITLDGFDKVGHHIHRTTVTTSMGYLFSHVPEGTYSLAETQPAGYADGPDFAGSFGGTVGNDLISNIHLGAGQNGTDYDFSKFKI